MSCQENGCPINLPLCSKKEGSEEYECVSLNPLTTLVYLISGFGVLISFGFLLRYGFRHPLDSFIMLLFSLAFLCLLIAFGLDVGGESLYYLSFILIAGALAASVAARKIEDLGSVHFSGSGGITKEFFSFVVVQGFGALLLSIVLAHYLEAKKDPNEVFGITTVFIIVSSVLMILWETKKFFFG